MSSKENVRDLIKLYKEVLSISLNKGDIYKGRKLDLKITTIKEDIEKLKDLLNNSAKLNQVIDKLERKYYQILLNRDEKEELFVLSIIGDKEVGKSTLVNMLLEGEMAKINHNSSIWNTSLYYGSNEDNFIKIIKKDGSYIEKSINEVEEIICDEENKCKESEQIVNDHIRDLEKHIYDEKELKERIEKEKKENLYTSDIVELQIPVKFNNILKDFRILDTPGINKKVCNETENKINEYYGRSNGVVWVFDASKIVEGIFDEKLIDESIKKVSTNSKSIIGVLNKVDLIEDKEKINEIVDYLKQKYLIDIVPISSRNAYEGMINNDKDLILESNIEELIEKINSKFKKDIEDIKEKTREENFLKITEECSIIVEFYKNELIRKNDQRISQNEYLKKKINNQKMKFKYEINKRIQKFVSNVKKRIDTHAEKIMEISNSKEKKEYIETEIIKLEELIEMLHEYEVELEKDYVDLYNYLLRKSCFKEYQYIRVNGFDDIYHKDNDLLKHNEEDYYFNIEVISFMSNIEMLNVRDLFLENVELALRYFMESLPAYKVWEERTYLNILKNNLIVAVYNIGERIQKEAENIVAEKMDEVEDVCHKLLEETFEKIYCSSENVDEQIEKVTDINYNLKKGEDTLTVEEIILNKVLI